MSINRREEILARVQEILVAQDGFNTNVRNRGLLDNDALPATILMDGDESTVTMAGRARPRGHTQLGAMLVTMRPQVFIILKITKPGNVNVGTLLNTHRGAILRAIAADAQLQALIGPNGDIAYDGAETDLKSGMPMEGQMQIGLSITCPLDPNA